MIVQVLIVAVSTQDNLAVLKNSCSLPLNCFSGLIAGPSYECVD